MEWPVFDINHTNLYAFACVSLDCRCAKILSSILHIYMVFLPYGCACEWSNHQNMRMFSGTPHIWMAFHLVNWYKIGSLKFAAIQFSSWMQKMPYLPVCFRMWMFRLPECEKLLPHWLHLNGFSNVCLRIWIVRLPECENVLSQMSHLTHFSPEWILLCTVKLPECRNSLSHTYSKKQTSHTIHVMNAPTDAHTWDGHTYIASNGLLAGMYPLMNGQIAGRREILATFVTLSLFMVGAMLLLVYATVARRREYFVTDVTSSIGIDCGRRYISDWLCGIR